MADNNDLTHDIYIVIVGTQNEIIDHLTKIREMIKAMTPGEMAQEIHFENNEIKYPKKNERKD